MSIASEITRLQGVKADILQTIANKGVTVPAGSALDDCPELINQINNGLDLSKFIFRGYTSIGNLFWKRTTTNDGWFSTPDIAWSGANTIEIRCRCIADDLFNDGDNRLTPYQIWTGTSAYIYGCTIKYTISSKKIKYTPYSNTTIEEDPLEEIVQGEEYESVVFKDSTGVLVSLYRLSNGNLVAQKAFTNTEVKFPTSSTYIKVGGIRFNSTGSGMKGCIDFIGTFVKVDGTLVWGIEP